MMPCKKAHSLSAYMACITYCFHLSFQYYTNGQTGKKFYSKKEVARYLNTKDTCDDVTQAMTIQGKNCSENNVSHMDNQDESFSKDNVSQMDNLDKSCSENNVSEVSFEGKVTLTFYIFAL